MKSGKLQTGALAGVCFLCVTLMLGGCSTGSHPMSAWTPRPVTEGTRSGSANALVFSPGLEHYEPGVDSMLRDRNEDLLAHQDRSRRDELLGLPPERRADLRSSRTFRGTRRAEDYVYPTRPYAYERRGYHRSHRHGRND